MQVIRPNCRQRFTPADYGFLSKAAFPDGEPESLWRYLVEDPSHFDILLDRPALYKSLLELQKCVAVSLPFYFYVLVRHTFLRQHLNDRDLADYVAALLSDFAVHPRMDMPLTGEAPKAYYFELLQELQNAEGERHFLLAVHIGNRALFEAGMLLHAVEERERRRAAPGIGFLEELGTEYYRVASQNACANQLGLVPLFLTLGQAFHTARLALNQISDEVVCLGENDSVSKLLRSLGGST
jgi:hypothetical protein